VFSQAKPKLAAYTHFVFLATEKVPAASVDDIITQTRKIYEGPLEAGEDLMSSEIGDTVTGTGASRSTSQTPEYPRGAPGYNFYATHDACRGHNFSMTLLSATGAATTTTVRQRAQTRVHPAKSEP
jgi:hypothetical protein